MYSRKGVRELFTRDGSQVWPQTDTSGGGSAGSQGWNSGMPLINSQDFGTPYVPATPVRVLPPTPSTSNSIHSSWPGPGASQHAGIRPPAPLKSQVVTPPEQWDLLTRDIRFGLHAILSSVRELPQQLKDITTETCTKTAKAEETKVLFGNLSAQIENLMRLVEKLLHLVDIKLEEVLKNKENSEAFCTNIAEQEGKLSHLEAKLHELEQKNIGNTALPQKQLLSLKKFMRAEVRRVLNCLTDLKRMKESESQNAEFRDVQEKLFSFEHLCCQQLDDIQASMTEYANSSLQETKQLNENFQKITSEIRDIKSTLNSITRNSCTINGNPKIQISPIAEVAPTVKTPLARVNPTAATHLRASSLICKQRCTNQQPAKVQDSCETLEISSCSEDSPSGACSIKGLIDWIDQPVKRRFVHPEPLSTDNSRNVSIVVTSHRIHQGNSTLQHTQVYSQANACNRSMNDRRNIRNSCAKSPRSSIPLNQTKDAFFCLTKEEPTVTVKTDCLDKLSTNVSHDGDLKWPASHSANSFTPSSLELTSQSNVPQTSAFKRPMSRTRRFKENFDFFSSDK